MNILITGATTSQAYQLERLLNPEGDIILADVEELPSFLLKSKRFFKISSGLSDSYAHELLTLCLDQGIKEVYPIRKAEIIALASARQLFEEYGILVVVPDLTELYGWSMKCQPGKIKIVREETGRGVFLLDNKETFIFAVEND
ncbi:ATP-grasp domain-containing protein [Arcticibacter eurypsychrophilus]|uniref:hypothetical protein n=1 Tax=Arcticibacter eurypsychrophilus TaxID=1434752 RepID=UPI00084DC13E|nr:hypothetical protein [Arcticibacter eurypsychrophilus]